MSDLVKSAIIRGVRTFIQVFLLSVSAAAVNIVDIPTAKAVVLAAGGFALAAAWRALLDPSPIPSAQDPTGVAIAGTLTPTPPPRGA